MQRQYPISDGSCQRDEGLSFFPSLSLSLFFPFPPSQSLSALSLSLFSHIPLKSKATSATTISELIAIATDYKGIRDSFREMKEIIPVLLPTLIPSLFSFYLLSRLSLSSLLLFVIIFQILEYFVTFYH